MLLENKVAQCISSS